MKGNKTKHSYLYLFVVGICMGIADLIPGISGSTIAFLMGVYEELLQSIRLLRLDSLKKIPWSFLLPLGGGILTSIGLLSKALFYLLTCYKPHVFAFFFGLMGWAVFRSLQKVQLRSPRPWFAIFIGAVCSFFLSSMGVHSFFQGHSLGVLCAGFLAAIAMLLPGISGSFLLQVLGLYPLIVYALAHPTLTPSLKLLSTLSLGVALGVIVFARIVSGLLVSFRSFTYALLIGFMMGGLRALWSFDGKNLISLMPFMLLGVLGVWGLERAVAFMQFKSDPSTQSID